MRIAITYICTGNYHVFWDTFYSTCMQYFYPEAEKDFYVFTDCRELLESSGPDKNIFAYYQKQSGWPYDTLLRFNSICTVQDRLRTYDYCYFWNANACFLREVNETVIPFPGEDRPILLWRHTHSYDDNQGVTFQPERDPRSAACVPQGESCHAYGGGFFGGRAAEFTDMCCELRDRIAQDLSHGIIAVWHDESHMVKYGSEIRCTEVPRNTVVSEEYADGLNCAVIFQNKDKFGGNGKLRDLPMSQRIKMRGTRILVKVGRTLGITPLYKKIRGRIRKQ